MAHPYLCLWCGEHGPHDDWQHHTTLRHRYVWHDWQRCRRAGVLIWAVGVCVLLGSVVLGGQRGSLPLLTAHQASLLWLLGLACLADAAALWLSCWGLARILAWQTARARGTTAHREVHRLRCQD